MDASKGEELDRFSSALDEALKELELLLGDGEYERAYDLVDAIHMMPEIIADYGTLNDSFWQVHIAPYRNRWNRNFLVEQQKYHGQTERAD